jgi:hypothetical protein
VGTDIEDTVAILSLDVQRIDASLGECQRVARERCPLQFAEAQKALALLNEKLAEHTARPDIHGLRNYELILNLSEDVKSQKKLLQSLLVTMLGALCGIVYEIVSSHLGLK